jgi:hypothetical protein
MNVAANSALFAAGGNRPVLRPALASDASGVSEPQLLDGKGDDTAERMELIPIRLVIRIAESRRGEARLQTQRDVDHRLGIARIERSYDERPVRREDSRVDADTERQGKNRHRREPGIPEQGARAVPEVLKDRFEQDHLVPPPPRSST